MNESGAVNVEEPVSPVSTLVSQRSSGDASNVGFGKEGISRVSNRIGDSVSKSKVESVEGNLRLERIMYVILLNDICLVVLRTYTSIFFAISILYFPF